MALLVPATAFSYQPRPSPGDPRGPKAQGSAFGDTIFGSNGKKNLQKWVFFHVFPGTSPEKRLTFKDV